MASPLPVRFAVAARPLNRNLIRAVAALKLWGSNGPNLDYDRFRERIAGGADCEFADLRNLLRRDQKPDLDGMMRRVIDGFRFLNDMTNIELTLSQDDARRCEAEVEALRASIIERMAM